MDKKALYTIPYGLFVLSARSGDKCNACITNTCMQVANDPVRVVISVLNQNYTCDLIKESGRFCLTVLDRGCTAETIAHFGYQSGRNVDKFAEVTPGKDAYGIPYLPWQSCAYLSAKVISQEDLGSHTMFVAEVEDAHTLSSAEPLTYAWYQQFIKPHTAAPAPQPEKKIVGWRCKICNYVYEGAELPADYTCPLCGHPAEDFEPIYE